MIFFPDIRFPYAAPVPDGHSRQHRPLYYGIQFNESGALRLRIGNEKRVVCQGPCCFITHPGKVFEYSISSTERHHFLAVCFTGDLVREFLRRGLLPLAPIVYPVSEPEAFRNMLHRIIRGLNFGSHDLAVVTLEEILLKIQKFAKTAPGGIARPARSAACHSNKLVYQKTALTKLAEAIRENPEKSWDWRQEAEILNITPRHFLRLFSAVNEITPGALMVRSRLARGALMLLQTQESIRSIANACAFSNEFYFSRLFKKYYSLPPRTYRAEFGNS